MTSPPAKSNNKLIVPGMLLAILAVGVIVAYFVWFREKPGPGPIKQDLVGAAAANTRGVAQMERYQYVQAERDFDEAVRLAPEWTPAKINLGIAIMNQNTPETKERAEKLFQEMQQKDPDNKHVRYCLGIILADRGNFAEAHEHFVKVGNLDPDDPHTWLRIGDTHPSGRESAEAMVAFEKALKLNPNMNAARYKLAMALRLPDR